MKTKITLLRAGRPAADLLIDADAEVSIGSLATHLARTDPAGGFDPGATYTIAVGAAPGRPLNPHASLSDGGLLSGMAASVVKMGADGAPAEIQGPAATLVVVAGPDTGAEFPLSAGSNLVGRANDADVRLSDPMVSRHHARIHVGETVEIIDLGSANGILSGDSRVDRTLLRPGDTVRIGDSEITAKALIAAPPTWSSTGQRGFNRPPRSTPAYAGAVLKAPQPPERPKSQRFPILPLFAPVILGVVIYLSTKALTSLIFVAMSPVLMVANVAEGHLGGKRTYKAALLKFEQQVVALVESAKSEVETEVVRRRADHPSGDACAQAASELSPLLWSRSPDLDRFGELRIGVGARPSLSRVEMPPSPPNESELWADLESRLQPFRTVADVPVVANPFTGPVGIGGGLAARQPVVESLVVQAACLHSPAEVVVAVFSSPDNAGSWEWIKWLPHCLSPQSPLKVNPLASTLEGCRQLTSDLERMVQEHASSSRSGAEPPTRVLVLVDDDAPIDRSRLVELARRGPAAGLGVIWTAAEAGHLPAVCRTYAVVGQAGSPAAFHTPEGEQPVVVDTLGASLAEKVARSLSSVVDASARDTQQEDVPKSVSLLTLSGMDLAASPEAVIERWVENRSVLTGRYASGDPDGTPGNLRAVIGATAVGPYVLDLREHGPHALVGGTTGSGKSELLQSWIIGMALSNSPQRLTFLLVDYKGGAAFAECVKLPHTVGLVTDLGPHQVRRALTSLRAELRYREGILHQKRAKDLLTLERDGDADAPPSLVIVVDEFAALVQEVPEFVDGVVDVAQRGRSLGLHLILATQRPSGVIRENLRANTNLRLALRVSDESDSRDVIGSPMAAHFDPTTPGRAVSRTGPNQVQMFQAAYVGGWTSNTPAPPRIDVTTFGFGANRAWKLPPAAKKRVQLEELTDIQRIVANVAAAKTVAGIPEPRIPWQPELAPVYDLSLLTTRRRDEELVFAVADDPDQQIQPLVAFRPDTDGNLAIFGTANSGKTTTLRTLAITAGLAIRGGPCHVYALDFGARNLSMLDELPHVGSVINGSDHERISRLLQQLRTLIDERAPKFAKVGAGSITEYRRLAEKPDEPRVLLLIDGMGAFRGAYEGTEHARWFDTFLGIASEGRQLGVHVIFTADRSGAVPNALSAVVQRRLVLRLAEASHYSMFAMPTDVLDAKSRPGRGYIDEMECQVAVLGDTPDALGQAMAIPLLAESMRLAGVGDAPPIGRLAEEVHLSELPVGLGAKAVFGESGATLGPAGFEPTGSFLVAGPPGSGRSTALWSLAASLHRFQPEAKLFYVGNPRSALAGALPWERAATDPDEIAALKSDLPSLLEPADTPAALVVENLPEFVNGPADRDLQEVVKAFTSKGFLFLADGEVNSVAGGSPLLSAAKASRTGLVLQPEQSDAMLFKTQFPRVRKSEYPVGRGMLVVKGGIPELVQVALPG